MKINIPLLIILSFALSFFKVYPQEQYFLNVSHNIYFDNLCESFDGPSSNWGENSINVAVTVYNENNDIIASEIVISDFQKNGGVFNGANGIIGDNFIANDDDEFTFLFNTTFELNEKPSRVVSFPSFSTAQSYWNNPTNDCYFDLGGSHYPSVTIDFDNEGIAERKYVSQNVVQSPNSTVNDVVETLVATYTPFLESTYNSLESICDNQPLFLTDEVDLNNGLSFLWYYIDKNNETHPLPNTGYTYPLNLSILETIGDDYFDELGSAPFNIDIFYRVSSHGYHSIESDIVTINISICSPQLIEDGFSWTGASCSYLNDGSFSMTLDRDLYTNEELVVTLFYQYIENGPFELAPDPQQSTLNLTPTANGYTYNWPIPVLGGNYKVKYQTHGIGDANEPWASLEFSTEFTIDSPEPLTFSVPTTSISNVNCYNGNDGAFIITAKGGVGNYRYFLNNDGEVFFSNTSIGTDAIPINQTVVNLAKSTNTLRVQDANGCTEQN